MVEHIYIYIWSSQKRYAVYEAVGRDTSYECIILLHKELQLGGSFLLCISNMCIEYIWYIFLHSFLLSSFVHCCIRRQKVATCLSTDKVLTDWLSVAGFSKEFMKDLQVKFARAGYLTASIDCRYHGDRCLSKDNARSCYQDALVRWHPAAPAMIITGWERARLEKWHMKDLWL